MNKKNLLLCLLFPSVLFADEDFKSQISSIPTALKIPMQKYSWHPGCPVDLDNLAYLEISYWGFDNKTHQGALIVNQQVAKEVVAIFAELYRQKFPIEKMNPISFYQGIDNKSMAANNTSAFVCRAMTNSPNRLSTHSYGFAIDINPIQNPSVKGRQILPLSGKNYLNRSQIRKGMITRNDVVYKIFQQYGWKWGGDWHSRKDYQHFEKPF